MKKQFFLTMAAAAVVMGGGGVILSCGSSENDVKIPEQFRNGDHVLIEHYGGSPVDVTIYGARTSTRSVGETQVCFVTMDREGKEVGFSLEIEQLTPTQTKTTQRTAEGVVVASYICEQDVLAGIRTYAIDEQVEMNLDDANWVKGWWDCVKSNYTMMMDYIRGNGDLNDIKDMNNGLGSTFGILPYITELQVAIAAGIHCL
ncbi:MAG: hypothetical protein LBV18_00710 [Alistipes sp.]|jgi:hypothetical protein|nr:hypothetical protein [Alistipes sp.]